MAKSQNGWPVYASGTDPNLVALPWVTGRVRRGAVYSIFDRLCRRFHNEVEPIRRDWSWGWAYRAIRGATTGFSNHASGTAIDLNAPDHPMGVFNTFSPAERSRIRAIVAEFEGVVFWGGEWLNRPDDMHFEIRGTAATVERIAAKLSGLPVAPAPVNPSPGLPTTGVDNTIEEEELMAIKDELLAEFDRMLKAQRRVLQLEGFDRAGNGMKVFMEEVQRNTVQHPVWRGGEPIPMIQELADIKTIVVAMQGQQAGLLEALRQLSAGEDVDLDAVSEAAKSGVIDGLQSAQVVISFENDEG